MAKHSASSRSASNITDGSRLRINIFWNYTTGLTSIIGLLLLYPLAISMIGAELYGLWILTSGIIQLFTMSDFGLGTGVVVSLTAISDAPGARQARRQFVSTAVYVFLFLGLLLTAAYSIIFPLYLSTVPVPNNARASVPPMVLMAGLTLLVSVLGRAFNSVLWAENRPDIERKAAVVAIMLRCLGYVALVPMGGGLVHIVIVECLTLMLPSFVCAVVVNRKYPLCRVGLNSWNEHGKPLLKRSSVLSIGSLSQIGLYQLPLLIVGPTLGLNATTAFGALMRVYQSCRLVVSWVAFPFTYPLRHSTTHEASGYLKTCFDLTLTMGLLMTVPLLALPTELLDVWLGNGFIFAAGALSILVIGVIAEALAQPAELVLNLRGKPLVASLLRFSSLAVTVFAVLLAATTGELAVVMLATVAPSFVVAWVQVYVAFRVVPAGMTAKKSREWLLMLFGAFAGVVTFFSLGRYLSSWPSIAACALLTGAMAVRKIKRVKSSN